MSADNPLEPIRRQITALDQQLLELLAERRQLSLQVAQTKADAISPVRDPTRESALLARLVQQGRQLGLDGQYVSRLFHAIIEDSVLLQQSWFHDQRNPNQAKTVSVAYLGARGSYSHIAAYHYFERRDRQLIERGQENFDGIFAAVSDGRADYGILPVENTSSGVINEVFDLLQRTDLQIVGETTETIAHCLLLPEGRTPAEVVNVYAHPQVHAQCSDYLADKPWQQHYCASSAEAMQLAFDDPKGAAVGSADGGRFYQLAAVEEQLANQQRNESRFVVIARKAVTVPLQVPAKTTLLMATGQQAGALVEALSVLKQYGLTMTKLASRPIHGNPWEEMFYLDIAANIDSQAMQAALLELTKLTRFIKVLGCYPSDTILPTELQAQQLANDPRINVAPLHSRQHKPAGATLCIGQHQLDPQQLTVMVEHHGAVNDAEHEVREHGGQLLISPHQQATAALPSGQRILSVEQLQQLPSHINLVVIEPSQMGNSALLAAAGKQPRPVMLARAENATLAQWLQAAEQILNQGNQQVILLACRHQAQVSLNELAELSQLTHLPIIVEPGNRDDNAGKQVRFANAAKALGISGILVDLSQSQEPQHYQQLMKQLFQ